MELAMKKGMMPCQWCIYGGEFTDEGVKIK